MKARVHRTRRCDSNYDVFRRFHSFSHRCGITFHVDYFSTIITWIELKKAGRIYKILEIDLLLWQKTATWLRKLSFSLLPYYRNTPLHPQVCSGCVCVCTPTTYSSPWCWVFMNCQQLLKVLQLMKQICAIFIFQCLNMSWDEYAVLLLENIWNVPNMSNSVQNYNIPKWPLTFTEYKSEYIRTYPIDAEVIRE